MKWSRLSEGTYQGRSVKTQPLPSWIPAPYVMRGRNNCVRVPLTASATAA